MFHRAVPKGQRFKACLPWSEFAFNLYNNGIHHCVKATDIFPFVNDRLMDSTSLNKSTVGPLLEKALVQLLFDGKYELSSQVSQITFVRLFTLFQTI